jgi:hypothetical protein
MFDPSKVPEVPSPLVRAVELAPKAGYFVEFGVASQWRMSAGGTLAFLAEHRHAIGFDSFEGLPEEWKPGFPVGTFRQDALPLVKNATLIVGLFADTLKKVRVPVALCHIDCDLYASTVTALAWLKENALPGCLVVFDEFYAVDGSPAELANAAHERRALEESGLRYEYVCRSRPIDERVAIRLV